MDSFVKIQTLFDNESERNIEILQTLYQDRNKLKGVIESITFEQLNEQSLKGKKVLLKPNWVKHSKKASDELCLRTHDQFLLAALEVILDKKPSVVTIGDAPIQGGIWNLILNENLLKEIKDLSLKFDIKIIVCDFRRVTFNPQSNKVNKERRPIEDFCIFDLGKMSYLEPITSPTKNQFRVTQYNPDSFTVSHRPGVHKYCIARELFDADIVISLPKVKTHQKAGITNALKNIVGLNGDKDFLPHHRLGGTGRGGDCYPGNNILRFWAELLQDNANRKQGEKIYWFWVRLSAVLWRLSFPGNVHHMGAAWFGNDTIWRMVMDLNRIVIYGCNDGSIASMPKRKFYSLCDGIIGGQGDGPLYPEPLPLGIVCFTNDSRWADICMATLMGFGYNKIPLLIAAKNFIPNSETRFFLNSKKITLNDLKYFTIKTLPPPGWVEHLRNSINLMV